MTGGVAFASSARLSVFLFRSARRLYFDSGLVPGIGTTSPLLHSKGAVPMRRALFVGMASLLLCAPSFAQTLGTITGEVKDSTGAVLPGATVTVINKATNATRTTAANEVGLFEFPALPPGQYTVKSELDGFKTAAR